MTVSKIVEVTLKLAIVALTLTIHCGAAYRVSSSFTMSNAQLADGFGERGLTFLEDRTRNKEIKFARDAFSLSIDGHEIRSDVLGDPARKADATSVRYSFDARPYRIEVIYRLGPRWRFVSKQLIVTPISGSREFHVDRIEVIDTRLLGAAGSEYVATSRWVKPGTPGRDYGVFMRFPDRSGLFALVQNP